MVAVTVAVVKLFCTQKRAKNVGPSVELDGLGSGRDSGITDFDTAHVMATKSYLSTSNYTFLQTVLSLSLIVLNVTVFFVQELMEALLLMESCLDHKWLKPWYRPVQQKMASTSYLLRLSTPAAVALHLFALDQAILYDKVSACGLIIEEL